MTLKSLASHFNLERAKKYGSCHQPLPSKFKIKQSNPNNTNSSMVCRYERIFILLSMFLSSVITQIVFFPLEKKIQIRPSNASIKSSNSSSPTGGATSYNSGSSTSGISSCNVPSCRSSKVRPQLNPHARKLVPKSKRCKASALLEQIPVCKLQKTLIKYGCCHNMNVISLDFNEYPPNDHCC